MLEEMKRIIKEAGNIILQAHNIENGVESKQGSANFVTKYDKEVQDFLYQQLSILYPQAGFLGEEDEEPSLEESEHYFIIDPIDGTTNFIFGSKYSAISIALLHKNEVEIGMVYNPYLDELFYAQKGKGAFLNEKPLKVNDSSIKQGVCCFGTSPYYPELADQTFTMLRKVFDEGLDVRRTGSAVLDICYVAANRFVLFFEYRLSPWDYSAASLILTEAGGVITAIDKKELKYREVSSILAANQVSYEEFFKL